MKTILIINEKTNDYTINTHILAHFPLSNPIEVVKVPKLAAKERKEYINNNLSISWGMHILCADSDYTKTLCKLSKVSYLTGYVLDTIYYSVKLLHLPSPYLSLRNPEEYLDKIRITKHSYLESIEGNYIEPGKDIIKDATYITNREEVIAYLGSLVQEGRDLSIDIETHSLKHYDAYIETIAFAWDEHSGICLHVNNDPLILTALKEFFIQFKGKAIYHRTTFDVYVLIYWLFMDDVSDTEGLLEGLSVMLRNWDCTLLMSYLATNTCAGNTLSLKEQAQEAVGNYAVEEINDITKIPLEELMEYNLIDTLATWFVHNKYNSTLDTDNQRDIYENIFKPAVKDVIQMQLTGVPIDPVRVLEVEKELSTIVNKIHKDLGNTPELKEAIKIIRNEELVTRNAAYKKKVLTYEEITTEFNINSSKHLIILIYDVLGLPIQDATKAGQPSTGGKSLKALKSFTDSPVLDYLIEYKRISKILTSFIPAFKNAYRSPKDGITRLYGNFSLGGTVSGRLSSSKINLQQLPSSSTYGALIKSCFKAPKGWFMLSVDFSSLESRISALKTRDPNRLKVYLEGFDSHCLNSYSYWPDQMLDINPDSVESINSIKDKYPDLRQTSKSITFLCDYGGTYHGLMKNCGFPEGEAKRIEQGYRDLYKASISWTNALLDQASKDGYITAAFGLRVRTPLLKQVLLGNTKTPMEAEEEARTAGNAAIQSYGLLNTRAASEFMNKVRSSPYSNYILPLMQIHDAQYYLVPDDVDIILYVNKHLIEAINWNDDPTIYHPEVGLGGELGIHYPDWSEEFTVPNGISKEELIRTFNEYYK